MQRSSDIIGNQVVLDKTAFYPAGAPPNDKGTLTIDGTAYNIVDLKKEGDDIVHVLDKAPQATLGGGVYGIIDWNYRYACMRYHSALHLIDGVIEKYYGAGMATGSQIYNDRARMDLDMPELNRDKAEEIIERANAVAKEGHEITTREISVDEARKIPMLTRTETGKRLLETLKSVRVVEIQGVDTQADGGTHIENTREIGTITLSDFRNQGAKRKRIEIILK